MAIEDLKDLLVHFPELEELLSATYDALNANARWKAPMGEALKDYLRTWIKNSRSEFEWMKNWEKCPSETIDTSHEPYKQALQAVIEGRLADTKKREQISNRISQYIELRLLKTMRVFFQLLGDLEWDDEFLNLIIVTIEDLKDLLVRFPEVEELLSLAKDVLNANGTWKASIAETLKDCVRMWMLESTKCEWTENWVKSPSETIETTRNAQASLLKAWHQNHWNQS